ncbi:M23 family metallopeptidase [Hydrogenivirga sp. 128-5-R1-1]|uniref:M23 family metallopeptidase n=1 Tax=Hydrogenivirga sp. 128-5-R1-1 TaxID=392423 RepID=UPI00015F1906|nr:M23 family metallopeptidase [Hydrogenivirga sp. 128-5-R1-1]EDP75337.1 lipoprotein NlpD fragment [Hydrogenivirga sp. 128-5-R1-1]
MRKVLLLSIVLLAGGVFGKRQLEFTPLPAEPFTDNYPEEFRELIDIRSVENARPDIWPVVGIITSDYGWRRRGRAKEFHSGVDIGAFYGSKVVATAPGYVLFAGWIRGYGKTVIIYHGYGYITLYAHMSSVVVKRGEEVSKNRVIGYVGSSGRTTGPHLHYEVIKYGIRQNPIAYLP